MKKGYWVIAALVLLSIVVTIVFISMMPDQVPMHYNAAGQVDRMGSKYENLIFPGTMVIVGLALILARNSKEMKKNEEKVLLATGISLLACFNVLNVVLLYKALTYESGEPLELNVVKLVMVFLGALFVVLGNILPKVRRNSLIGLRVSWTMKSDAVWQKSQRFSGIAMVICGVLLLLSALIFSNEGAAVAIVVLTAAWIAVTLIVTYTYYKKEQAA